MKKLTIGLVVILALCSIARAQCREGGNILFARGKTSGTVKGTVTSTKAVCYKFRVIKEQGVRLVLTSPNKGVRFGVAEDALDADEIATDVKSWNGVVKGRYIVSIRVSKGTAAFTLRLTISKDDLARTGTRLDPGTH